MKTGYLKFGMIAFFLVLLVLLVSLSPKPTEASIPDKLNTISEEVIFTDSTTSQIPSTSPASYIYTGYQLPYASPRSIQIYWPISHAIDETTQGTSIFSVWAIGYGNPSTNILVNGHNVGRVTAASNYQWVSIDFPTKYLDQGAQNMIEIWTSTSTNVGSLDIAADAPSYDNVGEANAYYIRNNGGTANDIGPDYGHIYANLEVRSIPPEPGCNVPYFSQRDPRWRDHPLRTAGVCASTCSTIGACGCTLTSSAMIFNYFGANLTPATLSDCMGTNACPFYWGTGAACSGGNAQWVNKYPFSWSRLETEINTNKHPVILGMHKPGNTHWVVAVSGTGNDPANYTIHDPWPLNGVNMKLSAYNDWYLDYISVYSGQASCASLAAEMTNQNTITAEPVLAAFDHGNLPKDQLITTEEAFKLNVTANITGTPWLYYRTDITMTIQLDVSAADVADMLIWTDVMTETAWQPFSEFAYLPVGEQIYARFRNSNDEVSDIRSDTLFPPSSPALLPQNIYLPLVRK